MEGLTHLDESGRIKMVDVTDKKSTYRTAVASATVYLKQTTLEKIIRHEIAKGEVLTTAKIAGISAAKRTSSLIPLCHPLLISKVDIDFTIDSRASKILIRGEVVLEGKTGVEMEALTSVSVAALTIYDMCKAVDKEMVISDVKLLSKKGGKSGEYIREE